MKKTLKSKKIYILAITVLAVMLAVFFAGCTPKQVEVNKVDVDGTLGDRAFEYMQTLAGEELAGRTLGTQGELDGATYIAGIMKELGYNSAYSSGEIEGVQEFKTSIKRFDGAEIKDTTAHNVIFTKKSKADESKGEIILCCQYDNLYLENSSVSGTTWNSDGSYESGSGIAVLLTLAEELKDKPCDYDLTFAFFTGGCYGWKGAMNYVDNLDRSSLNNVALALNFTLLGGGDNWYIYSGESETTYGKYLYACSGGNSTAVPKDRNIGQFILSEDSRYNYANIGMLSNQYFFDCKDIPTANFISLNWEINDNPLFSEMEGKENIYHTKNDTLQSMIERKGEEEIKAQLFQVISATLTALDMSNENALTSSLEVAKGEMPDRLPQSGKSSMLADLIVKILLIAILIGISYVIKNRLYRNIDKYINAKKARESAGEEGEKEQEPFEFDVTRVDVEERAEAPRQEKNHENKHDDDPFV